MNTNLELDGELISIEQASPSDTRNTFDQDDFYPADGMSNYATEDGIVTMVAAVAGQNTPNYFDQDNFYPADGKKDNIFRNVGKIYGNAAKGAANFLSPEEVKRRQAIRKENKSVKNTEALSRAELNKGLSQDKPSDVELAKALTGTGTTTLPEKEGMSKNTKIAIGVGSVLVLGLIVFLIVKKKK